MRVEKSIGKPLNKAPVGEILMDGERKRGLCKHYNHWQFFPALATVVAASTHNCNPMDGMVWCS